MKKIEENLNELLEVFDGTGVPNNTWVKDKLEETLIVAKNYSIHNVSDSDLRFKIEADKSLIYDSKTDKDICMYFDERTRDWLLDLLNTYVE